MKKERKKKETNYAQRCYSSEKSGCWRELL